MKQLRLHIVLLLAVLLSGCIDNAREQEQKKWRETMEHADKLPYGSYLAYESLQYFFPSVHVSPLSAGFKFYDMGGDMISNNGKGRKLLVLSGFTFRLSEKEWSELKEFISYGNEVIIFSSELDKKIEQELNIKNRLGGYGRHTYYKAGSDRENKYVLSLATSKTKKYGYKGHSIKGYFYLPPADTTGHAGETSTGDNVPKSAPDSIAEGTYEGDSAYTDSTVSEDNVEETEPDDYVTNEYPWSAPDTLGYVDDSLPNMVRFGTGDGHITLHAAPLALSNYFLLQKGNEQYLSAIWHSLPADINHIYWCDYYERYNSSSSSQILWRYPATKLAILLALFTLLIYILFEGKRRQRIIPVIPAIKNDSVSFVETVGRLYYNKGNHANLADKMVQQFLEWVRTVYFLNTNHLNEKFIEQLSVKSGQPEATVRGLMEMIHEIRLKHAYIDDPYLYQLYNTIQQFYKNRRI